MVLCNGDGSHALSSKKEVNLSLLIDDIFNEILQSFERDLLRVFFGCIMAGQWK